MEEKKIHPGSENLKPLGPDNGNTKEITRMGGIASAEVKKKKKLFKDIAEVLLSKQAPKEIEELIRQKFPDLTDEELTGKMAVLFSQFAKAVKGDTRAAEFLRDTAGEKPIDRQSFTDPDGEPLQSPLINFVTQPKKEDAASGG